MARSHLLTGEHAKANCRAVGAIELTSSTHSVQFMVQLHRNPKKLQ
jgi:hypothetical protein